MADTFIKRKKQQKQALIRLFIMFAILVCLNILASYFNFRLDLTQEKRFTLSPNTKKMLRKMDDVAVITVYLKGDFPAGFKKLQDATRQTLQSFKEFGGKHIVFQFVNPTEGKSEEEKLKVYKELYDKGIEGTKLHEQSDDSYSEKIIFPWALVQYYNRQIPVNLLENHFGMSTQDNLFNSETQLEYKLADAINTLTRPDRLRIGYLVGNGERSGVHVYNALSAIAKQYYIDTVNIDTNGVPPIYDAVIINKPTIPFTKDQKLNIDQYVMHGGKLLWFVDAVSAEMDSLRTSGSFIALDRGLNLDDLLFKYGVRVNPTIIEDMQCVKLPVLKDNNPDQIELKDWMFFPVFTPVSNNPIVNNMGPILGQFVNSMDTIASPNIKKTILLQSSKYSRVESAPVRVSLSMTKYPLREDMFRSPYHPVAVLLEGKFESAFKNSLGPEYNHVRAQLKFDCDTPTSMIVVSDGDFIWNDFSTTDGPMETGYWQYTHTSFFNKSFLMNSLEYLTDHSGLLEARSKDLKLRLLDSGRVKDERIKWRIINICIPIGLVLIFASCFMFFRKRKYEKAA